MSTTIDPTVAPATAATAVDTTTAPTLAFTDVAKVFATGTRALEGVSIDVRPGEFVSVVGPSGCGKSTLLRLAAGLDDATEGVVDVRADTTSFVFQEATLLEWRTAQRNVELVGELAGVGAAERRRRAAEALELVGLKGFENQHPRALSGGMRMRVSIARALVAEPQLALFDEPFGALDEITRLKMQTELQRLFQLKGFAAMFITHSISEAVYLSSRVLVMSGRPGRIVDDIELPWSYPDPRAALRTRVRTHRRTPLARFGGALVSQNLALKAPASLADTSASGSPLIGGGCRGIRRDHDRLDGRPSPPRPQCRIGRPRRLVAGHADRRGADRHHRDLVRRVVPAAQREPPLPAAASPPGAGRDDRQRQGDRPDDRRTRSDHHRRPHRPRDRRPIGMGWAIVMSQWTLAEKILYPYAVILQTIPILALTPLIGIWMGYGLPARIVVCVIIAVFPMISNTLFGLQSATPAAHDLFTLQKATKWQRMTKLMLPAAIPSIFTGLRQSAGLAVIGAIVGDFFFQQGSQGIGGLLRTYTLRLNMEPLFLAIIFTALFGVIVFSIFAALDRVVVGRLFGVATR
jgi:NitT/TauT family transport system ATP-binding protein